MITTPNCAIAHIPKTGGTYIRELLYFNKIKQVVNYTLTNDGNVRTFAHEIVDARADENHHLPYDFADRFKHRIMVVRNPLTWYMSYFTHRQSHDLGTIGSWSCYRAFDCKCMANTFDAFMQKVFLNYPFGFLYQLYSTYRTVCKPTNIIHVENLFLELKPILEGAEGQKIEYLDKRVNSRPPQELISSDMLKTIAGYEDIAIRSFYGAGGV